MPKKAPPKFDFKVIPDGAFVIFRTQDPMALSVHLSDIPEFDERGITGTILSDRDHLEVLSDRDLASIGLKRIRVKRTEEAH